MTSSDKFLEVIEDLTSRFIINIPEEELQSFDRICFQIEAAYWYYEDFYREQAPELPHFKKMRSFADQMFLHCPFLAPYKDQREQIYASFSRYKMNVPTCGAIILNEKLDKCVMVKDYGARTWGFPKGKINEAEPEMKCAIREVYEETGCDISDYVREDQFLEVTIKARMRLYIAAGVDENYRFGPRTRKEVSSVEWHRIAELPTTKTAGQYYMVAPFVTKLRQWIKQNAAKVRAQVAARKQKPAATAAPSPPSVVAPLATPAQSAQQKQQKQQKPQQQSQKQQQTQHQQQQPRNALPVVQQMPSVQYSGDAWKTFRLNREAIMMALTSSFV